MIHDELLLVLEANKDYHVCERCQRLFPKDELHKINMINRVVCLCDGCVDKYYVLKH